MQWDEMADGIFTKYFFPIFHLPQQNPTTSEGPTRLSEKKNVFPNYKAPNSVLKEHLSPSADIHTASPSPLGVWHL